MPRAKDVKPGKWDNIEILFDDGEYSVIAGEYDGEEALGERYNGNEDEDDIGFPNQGKYPTWYVVPRFLRVPILHGLLDELAVTTEIKEKSKEKYVNRIFKQLQGLRCK